MFLLKGPLSAELHQRKHRQGACPWTFPPLCFLNFKSTEKLVEHNSYIHPSGSFFIVWPSFVVKPFFKAVEWLEINATQTFSVSPHITQGLLEAPADMDSSKKPGESPRLYIKATHPIPSFGLAFSHALLRQTHRHRVSNLHIKRPQLDLCGPAESRALCVNTTLPCLRIYGITCMEEDTGVAPQDS